MTYAKATVLGITSERTIVWILALVIVALCGLYVFFMNEAVFTAAKRAQVERAISEKSSLLSSLEFKAISMRNDVDIDLAYSLGYTDIDNARYISKKSVAVADVHAEHIQ